MINKKNSSMVFIVFLVIHFCLINCFAQDLKKTTIAINQPKNDAEVKLEELVRGKVSNYSIGNVYVLVHPVRTNLCFVQRTPSSINEDGTWQTLCYFGTKNQGVGEYFELIAIVLKEELKEGQTFEKLPPNIIAKSPIITVKRSQ